MSKKVLLLYFWEDEKAFKQLNHILANSEDPLDEDSQNLSTSLTYLTRISLRIPSSRIISFGEFLKVCRQFLSHRTTQKVTLKMIAQKANLALTKITELESDKINKISIEEIFKLEKALEAPLFLIISKFGHYSSWPVTEVERLLEDTDDDRRRAGC